MNSTHHQSGRLVLCRSPQDEAVEELASEQGWQRVEEVTEEGVRQVLWAVAPGISLTYTEDPVSHNAFAVLASEDRGTFEQVLDLIQDELMPWSRRALLISIDDARDALARARAVIRAGMGAPEHFDEDFFNCIQEPFGSPEIWVREAAVRATAYSPWPQYRPLLENMAQSDPEEKLRNDVPAAAQTTAHGRTTHCRHLRRTRRTDCPRSRHRGLRADHPKSGCLTLRGT